MMRLLSTTSLAAALAVGAYGLAGAQSVSPSQPGSAGGGMQAQHAQPGSVPGQAAGAPMGSSSGAAAQAGRMTEEQIRTSLQARGYSDINGLERDGDTFKVKKAKRYGKELEDLRVDASTGQVRDESRLSEDQAKNLLRDRGYSNVSDVKRDGDTISAKAKQNDRDVRLRVDARTGTVTQQQASN